MKVRPEKIRTLLACRPLSLVAVSIGLLIGGGCSSGSRVPADSEDETPWVLGNAAETFTPPSQGDLDMLEWVDHPVVATDASLREKKQAQGSPEISADQALEMRNDSPEANKKMLAALSQLAPEDEAGVDFDAKIVRHGNGDINSTNPLLFSPTVTETEYGDLTAFSVLAFDQDMQFFGPADRIVSWQSTKDGLIDKIVLRDDLTWSDGKPLTAHDIEFSFKVVMTDHPLLILPSARQTMDQIKAVVAYDDRTVYYFHKLPTAIAFQNILFNVLPKHIYEESLREDPSMKNSERHSQLEDHPVTCGPYELVSRKKGQEFVLRRRESWYMHDGKQVRPKPHFAEIRVKVIEDFNTVLQALKGGEIHAMELRAEQWSTQTSDDRFYEKNTKVYDSEWTEAHICWNLKTRFFDDKRVRWAMSYAVDYDELLNVVCHGLYEPGQGDFHPDSWMFPKDGPEPLKQDLGKAKELLTEAGWTDEDGDGFLDKLIDGKRERFEFNLMVPTTETSLQAATLLKDSLDRLGIICNVKPTEWAALVDATQEKRFDAHMAAWSTGADPDTNENVFATGQNRNYGSYSNPAVDELFKQGRLEFDKEKRAEIYGRIHTLLWEDQPYTWLFYRPGFYGFNKSLRAYNFSPRGPWSFSPGFDAVYMTLGAP